MGDVGLGGTAELLIPRGYTTVRGNQDRIIPESDTSPVETLTFVREQLGSAALNWLRALKPELVVDDIWLGHASPGSDATYLLWDVTAASAVRRDPDDVAAALTATECRLFLTGHDHVPATLQLPDGRLVINPGSVGLPAYVDDEPWPHVMRTGTPHARYSVVTRTGGGWRVTDRHLPYDWRAAATAAESNGRADWAHWLRTGWAG